MCEVEGIAGLNKQLSVVEKPVGQPAEPRPDMTLAQRQRKHFNLVFLLILLFLSLCDQTRNRKVYTAVIAAAEPKSLPFLMLVWLLACECGY